jgi:hypothetical protein
MAMRPPRAVIPVATIARRAALIGIAALAVLGGALAATSQTGQVANGTEEAIGRTPPRLSFVDAQVSFWRPGSEEWVAARVNTPLAPGDQLYTGSPGNVEIQIGGRAYVRAWAGTRLGLANLEPDFVQLEVTTGSMSLDIRRIDPGRTVEVDTPNAAFTIEHPGYYRLNVAAGRTSFITRRSGRATVTPAGGAAAAVASSEEVIVEGDESPRVMTYVAPELDTWDRWNYARTDALLDSLSARYLAADVYGATDLDQHGSWRVVETYGPVWVPTGVPAGWAPYSAGSWIWDPYYAWTWVDAAPWGWAPYHHGRWVFVGGFWAWAPGPVVPRAVYAPALVAFFGPRVGITIGVAGPAVAWVALGWGEPVVPWWGPPAFHGVPRWFGWGGPRVVNNIVIERTKVVHVHEIHTHRNAGERNAIRGVPRDRFGQGPVAGARLAVAPDVLEPVRGPLDVSPRRASLTADAVRGQRPPEPARARPVVATRAAEDPGRWLGPHGIDAPRPAAPSPRLVPAPAHPRDAEPVPRPPFGSSTTERPRPPRPPVPDRTRPAARAPATPKAAAPQAPAGPKAAAPRAPAPPVATPRAPAPPPAARTGPAPAVRALPGEPANRLSPGRAPRPARTPAGSPAGRAPG